MQQLRAVPVFKGHADESTPAQPGSWCRQLWGHRVATSHQALGGTGKHWAQVSRPFCSKGLCMFHDMARAVLVEGS